MLEETGLQVGNIKFLTATNDVFGEGKHYVTIFVTCTITGEDKVAKVCFPPPLLPFSPPPPYLFFIMQFYYDFPFLCFSEISDKLLMFMTR